jgi:hypothetical protein
MPSLGAHNSYNWLGKMEVRITLSYDLYKCILPNMLVVVFPINIVQYQVAKHDRIPLKLSQKVRFTRRAVTFLI